MRERTAVTVFVVDDDKDSRDLLAEILQTRGFTAIPCTCTECLIALDAPRSDKAVVVTDVEMPGMTGLELCDVLRERHPTVVSIVISGRATHAMAQRAKESGAHTFLPKPANVQTLELLLREVSS